MRNRLLKALANDTSVDQLDLPAGLLDLLARLRAHLVRAHGDGLGQIAVAEDLQPVPAVLERAGGQQPLDGHRLLGIDALQVAHVDDGVLHPERVGEAPLRDAALDGHLPTLEADEVHVAGAGFLSLPAAAGRLAGPARLAPPYPLLFLHSTAGGGSQSAQLVHLVSSNAASRCSLGAHPAAYTQCKCLQAFHAERAEGAETAEFFFYQSFSARFAFSAPSACNAFSPVSRLPWRLRAVAWRGSAGRRA